MDLIKLLRKELFASLLLGDSGYFILIEAYACHLYSLSRLTNIVIKLIAELDHFKIQIYIIDIDIINIDIESTKTWAKIDNYALVIIILLKKTNHSNDFCVALKLFPFFK